jgi:hypothetical protein
MSGEKSLKDHIINLINALTNLSPSRNIISQLILLTPEDQVTISHSFPEINIQDFREVLKAMGMMFGDKIENVKDSFAEAVAKLIHKTFDWLDNEYIYFSSEYFGQYGFVTSQKKMDDVRSHLAKLTGLHIDLIPNPYLEWGKLVMRKLSSVYGKNKITRFVKELLSQSSITDRDYRGKSLQDLINKLGVTIGATPSELKEICEQIVYLDNKSEFIGSSRYSSGAWSDLWIEHGKYHLDPLLYNYYHYTAGYDSGAIYTFEVRHKGSLQKALEELT